MYTVLKKNSVIKVKPIVEKGIIYNIVIKTFNLIYL